MGRGGAPSNLAVPESNLAVEESSLAVEESNLAVEESNFAVEESKPLPPPDRLPPLALLRRRDEPLQHRLERRRPLYAAMAALEGDVPAQDRACHLLVHPSELLRQPEA